MGKKSKMPTDKEIAEATARLESGDAGMWDAGPVGLGLLREVRGIRHDLEGLLQEVAELKNRLDKLEAQTVGTQLIGGVGIG